MISTSIRENVHIRGKRGRVFTIPSNMLKILYVILFIVLLSVLGCERDFQVSATGEKSNDKMKIIVALGDSLTAGYGVDESESYPALLEEKLQADGYNYKVINAGVSAETSSGTLSRLEWILTLKPEIVLLETGANDGLRGIDPQLVENNIREIIKSLKERDVEVLLAGMKMVWNLGPTYIKSFNGIYPKLAKEFNLVFLPFFLDGVAMENDLNLSDGMHPNGEGYRIITEKIYPYVLEAIQRREG